MAQKRVMRMMRRGPWIFSPALMALLVAALVAYSVIAEVCGFHLMGVRPPSTSALEERLDDGLRLWIMLASATGWALYLLKRRPPKTARVWPLLAVPFVMAIYLAACKAQSAFGSGGLHLSAPDLWWDVFDFVQIAMPLGTWGFFAVCLFVQAQAWRLPITPGVCPTCDYDLTGNTSGICPECGSRLVFDPSIPCAFYRKRYVWLPELSEFADARARYAAWQQAQKECWRARYSWLRIVAAVVGVLTLATCQPDLARLVGVWWYALLSALGVVVIILIHQERAHMRRALRRQLPRE